MRRHISFKPSGLAAVHGLRGALGIVIALAIGIVAGHPTLGAAAAGAAFQVGLVAFVGTYRTTLRAMLWTTVVVAVEAVIGAVTGQHPIAFAAAAALAGLLAGVLVNAPKGLADVGIRGATALIVLGQFPAAPATAAQYGLAMLLGGVIQVVLVLTHWQVQRRPTERKAVGHAYRSMARYAAQAEAETHLPEALALPTASALLADHPFGTARRYHGQLRKLHEEAEHIRASLVALATLAHLNSRGAGGHTFGGRSPEVDGAAVRAVLTAAGDVLDSLASILLNRVGRTALTPERLTPPLDAVERLRPVPGALSMVDTLFEQLGEAERLVSAIADRVGGAARPASASRRRLTPRAVLGHLVEPMRDATTRRHALRLSTSLVVAVVVASFLPVTEPAWLPFTTLLVLRPELTSTVTRGLERMLGTLLGALLAIGIVQLAHPNLAGLVLLTSVFAWAAYTVLNANFSLFTFGVTGFVTFLVAFEGLPASTAVPDRCLDTAVGGLIALLAVVVFPAGESRALRGRLAALIVAQTDFAATVLEYCACRADRTQMLAALDRARRLRADAESAVDRLRAEPRVRSGRRDLSKLADAVLTSSRRIAAVGLALSASARAGLARSAPGLATRQRVLPPLAWEVRRTGRLLAARAKMSDGDPQVREHALPVAVLPLRIRHSAVRTGLIEAEAAQWLTNATAELVDSIQEVAAILQHTGRVVPRPRRPTMDTSRTKTPAVPGPLSPA